MDHSLKRLSPTTWNCATCTLQNQDAIEECPLCGSSNPKVPHKKIKVSTSLEPPMVMDIPNGILCPLCTFSNKLQDSKCGMCNQSLFENDHDAPLPEEKQDTSTDLIVCPRCHFSNHKYNQVCISCDTPMDGEEPLDQGKSEDYDQLIEQPTDTKVCFICCCEVSVVSYPSHTKSCSQSLDLIQSIKTEYPEDFTTDQCHYCYQTLEGALVQSHYRTCKEKRVFFDDSKAFGKMTPLQIQAMKFMYGQSEKQHYSAKPMIIKKIRSLGYTYKDIEAVQHYMENYAPIIVHIHVAKYMHLFAKDTHYRNQFQTLSSSGSLSAPSRTMWQNRMFTNRYSKASPFERVKYGTINLTNDPNGVQCCSGYGASYFLLKEDVRKRCTFTDMDSSSSIAQIGVFKFGFHVLQKLSDVQIKALIQGAKAMQVSSAVVSTYKEIQIHGPLDFANDIQRLYVNQIQLLDPKILDHVKEFSSKFKVDYQVFKPTSASLLVPSMLAMPSSPFSGFRLPPFAPVPRRHPKKRKY